MEMEPHLKPLLEWLRPRFKTAIATNRMNTMGTLLKTHRLGPLFDLVVCATDVAMPKPHPEALFKVADHFGIPPARALYIGDSSVDAAVVGIVPLTPAMQTLAPGEGHRESILDPGSIAQLLPNSTAASDKPVVAVVDSGEPFDPMVSALRAGGLPVFRSADRAVRALCKWIDVKTRNNNPGS